MKTTSHSTTHEETLHRLRRIAGQVQGVQRMVEEKKYCIDIVTQLQAARSALRAVELQILRKHMSHCVGDAFAAGSSKDAGQKMDELLRVMKKQY
jgi:DNA-binding FrmR family transcriptional regulator